MQSIPGMTPAGAAQAANSASTAAQAAKQKTAQAATIERMVVREIEAWQKDRDPGHLLRAISIMQGMVGVTASMASSSVQAAGSVTGSAKSWQPEPPQGFSGAEGSIPIGGLADAAQDAIDRAADFAKSRVRNARRNFEDAAQSTYDTLKRVAQGVMDQAKQGGHNAAMQGGGRGGFDGRAQGQIPGAAGGGGGRAQGSQGGFGGRASGTIPQR